MIVESRLADARVSPLSRRRPVRVAVAAAVRASRSSPRPRRRHRLLHRPSRPRAPPFPFVDLARVQLIPRALALRDRDRAVELVEFPARALDVSLERRARGRARGAAPRAAREVVDVARDLVAHDVVRVVRAVVAPRVRHE